ncbi:hypothetical protein FRC11_008435 [Ceratobasidium sp. 423]|nr:hypothetical protein FRC11_008435 [Ceratobasidium sp. 423]
MTLQNFSYGVTHGGAWTISGGGSPFLGWVYMFGSRWQTGGLVFVPPNSTATMLIDLETPRNQYAKREYYIRLIGRVPVNVANSDRGSDSESTNNDEPATTGSSPFELRLEGTPLCSIDVTMSHVAVMYAAGRLLDSIREPFNASIIRAEMDLLRDKEEIKVSPEDYEKWKKEKYEAKSIDPLVSEAFPDPEKARESVPQCPYLCQLLFKSFSVGSNPGFWCGAREVVHLNGNDGPRNVRGRAGADSLERRNLQTWFLYIDVSDPLRPRYAFMEEQNIIDSTRLDRDENRKPLYIFNAREHAYQLMIPESEQHSDATRFGEPRWEPHWEGVPPTGRRKFIKLPDDPGLDPDYRALLVSRMKRAQQHPAVIRMEPFGWFTAEDAIKPDGSAILQGIWRYSLKHSKSGYHESIVRILLDTGLASGAVVVRSQAMNEPDYPDSPELEYSFTGLPELTTEPEISLKFTALRAMAGPADPRITPGGILSVLEALSSTYLGVFPYVKLKLAQNLKERSSRGGTGFHEEAFEWLSSVDSIAEPDNQLSEDPNTWLERDYDMPDNDAMDTTSNYDGEMWWILAYQGLCYRASVGLERLSRSISNRDLSESNSTPQHEPAPVALANNLWNLLSDTEFPGRPLGDVAHPAFDVSYFPRVSEHQLLSALEIWSKTIWLPNLKEEYWNVEDSTPIPLRTLNVSGCHFVTRNTIRQALQIVPSITRIIMIGCKSFSDTDLMVLSLDGTLNNVDCILTPDTVRDPFCNPRHKKQWRDDAYNRARQLLPQAPNEKIQANLDSVPGVFFNSTEEFKFKYSTKIYDTYYTKGLSSRSLSHSLARPPALGFDPTTGKVACGPPRFSIVLATHTVHDVPITGATLPRANEEWIFAYQFRDVVARMQTYWVNGPGVDSLIYPESSSQDCWAFIRYGRDANPLSHEIPTVVLYNVREFRQAICPDIPILEDEARWMARVEDILANGTWHPSYPIVNWDHNRRMARDGDPTWARLCEVAKRMTKPKYMKDVPHELMLLIERMMTCQMNAGSDPF